MYTQPIRPNELYHHGIKGMHWGIRRFQNKDGSYTSSGKKRYGIGAALHKRQVANLRKRYKNVSDEELEKSIDRRNKAFKKALIIGGTAVGVAVTAYAVKKIGREYADNIIRSGTKLQTLSETSNRMATGDQFFTSYRKRDNNTYKALFGKSLEGNKYVNTATVNKNLKIASTRHAKAVFEDLKKNNPEFKRSLEASAEYLKGHKEAFNNYKVFNKYGMVGNGGKSLTPDQKKYREIFYDALKNKGYAGLHDINDRKYSGFNTNGVIVFDRRNISIKDALSQLTDDDIKKAQQQYNKMKSIDALTHPRTVAYGVMIASNVGSIAGEAKENAILTKEDKNRRKNKDEFIKHCCAQILRTV